MLFEIKSLSKSSWSFKISFFITGVTESSGWLVGEGVEVVVEESDKDDEDEVGDEAEVEVGVTDLYWGTDRITFLALCPPRASSCLRLRSNGDPEGPQVSLLVSELMICFTGLAPFLLLAPVGLLTAGGAVPPSMILLLKYPA